MGMDKNSLTGLLLIFMVILTWQYFLTPSQAELTKQKHTQDSIRVAQQRTDSLSNLQAKAIERVSTTANVGDSTVMKQLGYQFGAFAPSAVGKEKTEVIENELFKVTFTNKGGHIKEVELKKYDKIREDENHKETKSPVKLLEDSKNRFEYILPVAGLRDAVRTSDLFFTAEKNGNTIIFRAPTANGGFFEQKYTLTPNNYHIDYEVKMEGLNPILASDAKVIRLNWVNYLDKIEKNSDYERNYSTVYYKAAEKSPSYCDCTASDTDTPEGTVKWASNTQQFFNSSLIANTSFASAKLITEVQDVKSEDLKKLTSELAIPYNHNGSEIFGMKLYVGPNEFKRLSTYNVDLQDIIPYGSSILGTINRWIIRPIFTFLLGFIGSKGIVIILLTLLVKLLLFPLSYKMLHSQAKMTAMKPEMEKIKKQHPDDPQKQQMETMKMYQEAGVNPLGGCLPMILQMPIWIALFRFFPASIEFRQASFLWATDLTSYDSILNLPFNIPLWGSHVSLFTILWMLSTLIYTYYSMQNVDLSSQPAMKYVQYFMPIIFGFTFNNYASGLSCYMFFSNLLNIGQTLFAKNFMFDNDKMAAELAENRKKPKKTGGFQARLEQMMREQQRLQQEQQNKKK